MVEALAINGLTKVYPGGLRALKGIDLRVEQGDFFALLGANGAGKSTAISIICSLLQQTSGTVRVFGHDINTARMQAKACIGVVPQEFNFNIFETPLNILINQAGYYGIRPHVAKKRAEALLEEIELWPQRHAQSIHLSGGMKRRLMIARALVHEPQLLILDEPTAGVDLKIRHAMWDFFAATNKGGTTIILTTHYLEEAENMCRNIAIIHQGEIIAHDSKKALLSTLNTERIIIETVDDLPDDVAIDWTKATVTDARNIELIKSNHLSISDIADKLHGDGIRIKHIRYKQNRLETLFLDMLYGKHGEEDAS